MRDDTDTPPNSEPSNIDHKHALKRLALLDPIAYGQQRKAAAKTMGVPVGTLDSEVRRLRRAPAMMNGTKVDFVLGPTGEPLPLFANAAEIIRTHMTEWPLRFDEFSQRMFLGPDPMTDGDLQRLGEWVQRHGVLAHRKVIDDAAIYVASQRRFHEVRDWLDSLTWDRIPRIAQMLEDHGGADESELSRAFLLRWMIQAVARIYEPGCQADATLMLEGGQDIGKSTFFRMLFGDRWFTDHLPSMHDKDAMIQLLGIWCVEISELAAVGRTDNAKVKQFLTSRDDRFRLPWDRLAKQHPRQSVFGATVNPSGRGHLKDETGGRRWWPIVVSRIDNQAIYDNREQYWAEAVALYRAKQPWWLKETELAQAARLVQADRYERDVWQDELEDFVADIDFTTLPLVFKHCLNMYKKSEWGQREENRIARCFSAIGWVRKQRRVHLRIGDEETDRVWGYLRPPADGQRPVEGRKPLSPVMAKSGDITGYVQQPDE